MNKEVTNYYMKFEEEDINDSIQELRSDNLIDLLSQVYEKTDKRYLLTSKKFFTNLCLILIRDKEYNLFGDAILELAGFKLICLMADDKYLYIYGL